MAFGASIIWMMQQPYTAIVPQNALLWVDLVSFVSMLVFAISGPSLPRLKADFSYSLYLFHCIVRGELLRFMPVGNFLFGFMLLSTLPICAASWYLIEKPALSMKRRKASFSVAPAE
jgi:peptidoglycan/LPS O-acetylase OafA/YrhL